MFAPIDSAHRDDQSDIDFGVSGWLLKCDPRTRYPNLDLKTPGKSPKIVFSRSNIGRKHSNTPSKRILNLWSDLFLEIVEYYRESVLKIKVDTKKTGILDCPLRRARWVLWRRAKSRWKWRFSHWLDWLTKYTECVLVARCHLSPKNILWN